MILADRKTSIQVAPWLFMYKFLVGKEYFLNLQIANLEKGSSHRNRALLVRDASVYLSSPDKRNAHYLASFIQTIKSEKPDLVLLSKSRMSPDVSAALSEYNMVRFGRIIAFGAQRCNFKRATKP